MIKFLENLLLSQRNEILGEISDIQEIVDNLLYEVMEDTDSINRNVPLHNALVDTLKDLNFQYYTRTGRFPE